MGGVCLAEGGPGVGKGEAYAGVEGEGQGLLRQGGGRVGHSNHLKGEGQDQGVEGCITRQGKGGERSHQERVGQPCDAGGGRTCGDIGEGGHGV